MFNITGDHFNEIIRYPFKGQDWFKLISLQGATILLLCPFFVGIPLLTGFIAAHTQRGIKGSNDYPTWNDWGVYWSLGWKLLAVNLLYYLPFLGLMGIYMVMILIPVLLSVVLDSPDLAGLAGVIGTFGMVFLYPLMFVYIIFYTAIQMAATPKIAAGGSIHDAISWKRYLWPYLKANVLGLLVVYLMVYLVTVVSMVGMMFLFIGLLFTMPFSFAFMGYAHGVVYRLSSVK